MTQEPGARPSATLATVPVALDPLLGWLLHLAWLMPALAVAVRHIRTMVLLGLNGLLLLALDAVVGAYVLPLRSHNNVFIEHDPWLGWKLRRGLTVVRKERQYTAQETINPVGFRTRPLPFDKPPGVKRILFLGDSHTEGYTVNDAETYPVLVEQQ